MACGKIKLEPDRHSVALEAEYQAALAAYKEATEHLSKAKAAARPEHIKQHVAVRVTEALHLLGLPSKDIAALLCHRDDDLVRIWIDDYIEYRKEQKRLTVCQS